MSVETDPSTANFPRLPYDIQLLIVDEAASDPALLSVVKALALTHHALREPCQRYLFSAVPYKRYLILLKILKRSPQIADYIRTLVIPNHHLVVLKNAVRGAEFLSRLHCLRNLRIFKKQPWLEDFSWRQVHPLLATELLRIMHSPVLRSLELCDTEKFPRQDFLLLGRSPNLTYLKIARLRLVDSKVLTNDIDDDHNGRQTGNLGTSHADASEEGRMLQTSEGCPKSPLHDPPKLRKLFVGLGSRDVLKLILGTTPEDSVHHGRPLFDLSCLRQLYIFWRGAQTSQPERLLMEASPGVEDLEVACTSNSIQVKS